MGAVLSVFFSLFGGRGALPASADRGGAGGEAAAAAAAAGAPASTDVQLTEAEARTYEDFKKHCADAPKPPLPVPLDAAAKQRLQGILKIVFDMETLTGKRVNFDPKDVIWVCETVVSYLRAEPMLIEDVPFGITIVGDLHGQLHDLHRVFAHEERDGKQGWENMKFLFLGDYVDRGRQALEIVMALFSLKMLYPDRIFLLRGNHEFVTTQLKYGFATELTDRYSEETARILFFHINAAFCWLSVAAILGNEYYCAHGGVSQAGVTRRYWRGIRKPIYESNEDAAIHDAVWSDPAIGLRGSAFNTERGTSHVFGLDSLVISLYTLDCYVLFRAHTQLQEGYEIHSGVCVSIFTATGTNAPKRDNHGAVAVVDERGKLRMRKLRVDLERVELEKKLKKMDNDYGAFDGPPPGGVESEDVAAESADELTTYEEDEPRRGTLLGAR